MKGRSLPKKLNTSELSLRSGLVGIVIACWFFPMLLIISIMTLYISNSIGRQFDEALFTSVSNAVYITRHTLQYVVAASREASYNGSIEAAYNEYKKTDDSQALFNTISGFMVKEYRFDDNILAAMVFFHENTERIYETHNPSFSAPYTHIVEYRMEVHEKAIETAKVLDTRIAFISHGDGLYIIRNIVDRSYVPYAVIVLKVNISDIKEAFDGVVWEQSSVLYLNDTYVNIGGNGGTLLQKPDKNLINPDGFQTEHIGDIAIVSGRETIDGVDILYTIEIDRKGMINGLDDFAPIFYFLTIMLFPLLAFVLWYFYRSIFNPIKILSNAAKCIQDGQLGKETATTMPNREFEYLNKAFNQMSVKLKQQFEQLYSEELALRDARIMALQLQINPHFLNNTLEIINWESRLGNNAKVSNMIEALSTTLDAAMDRKNRPTVTLKRELSYLDAYLYIISERFGKRLTIKKEIDANLLGYNVPRLILQPVAENAVEHGVAMLQKGELIITACKSKIKNEMLLKIENNKGLTEEDKNKIERLLSPDFDVRSGGSLNLGIHNVNMRLKIIYGHSAGLKIYGDEERTTAVMNIPLKYDNRLEI